MLNMVGQAENGNLVGPPVESGLVVKNPLSPVEHPGGAGVNCELFELGVEQFVTASLQN